MRLTTSRKCPVWIRAAALGLVTPVGSLAAQQTLFNVPSSDVLDRGKVYAEIDSSFKGADPKFSSVVPRFVLGLGGFVEAGLNITGNTQPGPDRTTLVPTIKLMVYNGGENGWTLIAGDNLHLPIRNRSYVVGNYLYAQLAKTLKGGTRITAGGYHFTANVVAPDAQRAGGQFGFEHAVHKKLTIAADWFTGNHANGYLTPGVIFKACSKATGYFGYSIGNRDVSRGNHFLLIELGLNFN